MVKGRILDNWSYLARNDWLKSGKDAINEGVLDYYLLPGIDMTWGKLRVAEANGIYLDTYRCDTLDYFFSLMEHINLEDCHEQ